MKPDTLHYGKQLYQNEYVVCSLYEDEQGYCRVFEFQEEMLQHQVVRQLMKSQERYLLDERRLLYIRSYEEGSSLEEWLQEPHALVTCIALCEDILFTLIQQQLPLPLLATTLHRSSIAIGKRGEIYLFQHPQFLLLRHVEQISYYQECAELCYQIMTNAKELKHVLIRRKKQWRTFTTHVEQHTYNSYEYLVDDIVALVHLLDKKRKEVTEVKELITYVCLVLVMIGFGVVGYTKLSAYLHQSYERLPYIGTQATQHE